MATKTPEKNTEFIKEKNKKRKEMQFLFAYIPE